MQAKAMIIVNLLIIKTRFCAFSLQNYSFFIRCTNLGPDLPVYFAKFNCIRPNSYFYFSKMGPLPGLFGIL
jgi:hypothetical protein